MDLGLEKVGHDVGQHRQLEYAMPLKVRDGTVARRTGGPDGGSLTGEAFFFRDVLDPQPRNKALRSIDRDAPHRKIVSGEQDFRSVAELPHPVWQPYPRGYEILKRGARSGNLKVGPRTKSSVEEQMGGPTEIAK